MTTCEPIRCPESETIELLISPATFNPIKISLADDAVLFRTELTPVRSELRPTWAVFAGRFRVGMIWFVPGNEDLQYADSYAWLSCMDHHMDNLLGIKTLEEAHKSLIDHTRALLGNEHHDT